MSVYIVDVAQVNVSSWYYLPLYFQAVRGASPVRSGVLLMPMVVVQALVGVAVGGIIFRYGWIRPILWTGMALSTVGLVCSSPWDLLLHFQIWSQSRLSLPWALGRSSRLR